jgi:phosphoribosylaminoimidazolecarboxamide formyltransferase/IMP cyclohydrolase
MKKLALLSVSDKSGLVAFAQSLSDDFGYRILSTGGTARALVENGIPVTEVSDYTGFPELMDGRVKTLHPKVHGGILCRRSRPDDCAAAEEHGIGLIDLVVVNLYPFESTVADPSTTLEVALENIDIGGPSMVRSAAKNFPDVTVVCDPSDYPRVLAAMSAESGLQDLRKTLALKAFRRTSAYDASITEYLGSQGSTPDLASVAGFPGVLRLETDREAVLRYGENPHQQAALYGRFHECFEQLQGKALSFINVLDISAAAYLIGEFEQTTVAILKHTTPCGVGSGPTLAEAWEAALATDREAPFGGIIVANRTLEADLAAKISELFTEIVIAPGFTSEALALLGKRTNLRLMTAKGSLGADALQEVRSVAGGYLLQDRDLKKANPDAWKVVSVREPTVGEREAMLFGWRVVKHVKSNAIVYAAADRTLGIGAGQMSRVDASRIAVWKAANASLSLAGSVIASDALFPFADGLKAAAEAGATAAVQPGGSMRDEEVIAAADQHGMAMVFTGVRHFRH